MSRTVRRGVAILAVALFWRLLLATPAQAQGAPEEPEEAAGADQSTVDADESTTEADTGGQPRGTATAEAPAERSPATAQPNGEAAARPAPSPQAAEPDTELAHTERLPEPSGSCLADPTRAEILGAWIDEGADLMSSAKMATPITFFVLGAAFIGLSIWPFTEVHGTGTSQAFPLILGSLALGAGATFVATGIEWLLSPPLDIARRTRWRQALEGGLSAAELAEFEGELRQVARASERRRTSWTVGGIASAVAGGSIVAVAGLLDGLTHEDRTIGYTLGGALGAFGVLQFAFSFVPTMSENAWNAYKRGEGPHAGLTWRPLVGLGSLGLYGTF